MRRAERRSNATLEVPPTPDIAAIETAAESDRRGGVKPSDLMGAEIFREDVELVERSAESLMRSHCYENAVALFAIALKWRVALQQRDRRDHIETRAKRGAWAEMIATSWLMEDGYEVFRNVSPAGPIDLVAVNPAETILVDVKTSNKRPGGGSYQGNHPTEEQKSLGVRMLFVDPDGTCEWRRDA